MIYYIEGKLVAEETWVRGMTKYSLRVCAEDYRKVVQGAFDQYCRWEMETRVVGVEGNILDR
jgi:hypothetical protein